MQNTQEWLRMTKIYQNAVEDGKRFFNRTL